MTKRGRTHFSEVYVLTFFLFSLSALFLLSFRSFWLVPCLVAYRLIDSTNYQLSIIFVDRYKPDWSLRSLNRSLILLFINYFEIIVGFSVLYLAMGSIFLNRIPVSGPGNALYFSAVTITSLGDGRFAPHSMFAKGLVSVETILGVIFLVLIVGTFIGGIPRMGTMNDRNR